MIYRGLMRLIYNHSSFIKYVGFTLAEVLITLLIIGVVASLVIPAIINDIQEADYKIAYKKAYSVASQSLMQSYNDGELTSRNTYQDAAALNANYIVFKSKFIITTDCPYPNASKCWANGEQFWGNANLQDAFIDNAGMSWGKLCNSSCGFNTQIIFLDTNGLKRPNVYGKDRFYLYMSSSTSNNEISTTTLSGVPKKFTPDRDWTYQEEVCPTGPCYYTSYLK
jgi:prepilin-type N-terminal cleavage/methylation domain-containing protein